MNNEHVHITCTMNSALHSCRTVGKPKDLSRDKDKKTGTNVFVWFPND